MINSGDTAWILMSTALVTLMTPALAFFYGGMVRRKNILSTLNLSLISMGLIGVQWVLVGYSLSFGDHALGGFVGNLEYAGLASISPDDVSGTIPTLLFVAFQGTFAIITPALITGAFVERIKFITYVLFAVLWSTLVYNPVCHWVWGGGFLGHSTGVLDFAGGTVVHITAGYSALVFALMIRKRQGFKTSAITPSNIPFTVLGAGLLWAGWFGFNGGSALAADGIATIALLNTNTAAAAAMVTWMILSWIVDEKPSVLGIVTGAVVGLVAITPAAGFVTPLASIAIGAVAAPISFYAIRIIHNMGIDESLDVFACHGMAGTWGALATGLFATSSVNSYVTHEGVFYGGGIGQLWAQLYSVIVVGAYAVAVTVVILLILKKLFGLEVEEREERIGLDISDHRDQAYS